VRHQICIDSSLLEAVCLTFLLFLLFLSFSSPMQLFYWDNALSRQDVTEGILIFYGASSYRAQPFRTSDYLGDPNRWTQS